MADVLSEIKGLMCRIDEGFKAHQDLIAEGLSQRLYHFTTLENGFEICKENVIYLQSAYAKDSDNYDRKRKFYLSCTRIPSAQFGYSRKFMGGGARLVLDGDMLSQNFKGKPVNYWGGGVFTDKYRYYENLPGSYDKNGQQYIYHVNKYKKAHPDATEAEIDDYMSHNLGDAQWHTGNESEDRIFSYEPAIRDANRYIISIDFLMPNIHEDEGQQNIAVGLLLHTQLRRKIRIYDSEKAFNNQGEPMRKEDILEFGWNEKYTGKMRRPATSCLKTVIDFIAYGNPEYEGKKFGQAVAKLLKKYELSEYTHLIGDFHSAGSWYNTIENISDNLDSVRRELSDNPTNFTSKVIMMLTDYFKSIGANSFREGYKIKKQMVDDHYRELRGERPKDFFDKIDTEKKVSLLTFNSYTIIPNPDKEKFSDLLLLVDIDTKSFANELSCEVMEYHDYATENGYNTKSKNTNSLYQYLYKLMTKGSIKDTMDALKKLGISNDYMDSYGIRLEYKNYDWWEANSMDTLTTTKTRRNEKNYDYKKLYNNIEKELYPLFYKNDVK